MPDVDRRSVGRLLLDENRYLTLGTADAGGRPWTNPVWYAHRDYRDFIWASRPGARHSVNLQARPEVAIVVFDSSLPPEQRQAVYMDAVAREVSESERAAALEIYNSRLVAAGFDRWAIDKLTGDGAFRLYVAVAREQWMLHEEHDERLAVTLSAHVP